MFVLQDIFPSGVFFEIHRLDNGSYCVWIWRDSSEEEDVTSAVGDSTVTHLKEDGLEQSLGLVTTLNAFYRSDNFSIFLHVQMIKTTAASNKSTLPVLVAADERNDHLRGPFFNEFALIREIGRGSYGSVYLCARRSDFRMAVTKFILKDRVHGWHWPGQDRKVPREVHLLGTIEHPNVIRMLSCLEGPGCYALVMEKHGAGMDLFEFVDREPKLDEALASYIFRQVWKGLEDFASSRL